MAHITRTTSRSELAPALQSTASFSPAFLGMTKLGLDLAITDIYSQKTFLELINERHKAGFSYFVAATRDVRGQIKFFDATSLMTSYFKFNDIVSPLNRQPLDEMKIYECKPNQKNFVEFCDFYQLLDQQEHYAKFLLASDLNIPAEIRGECRYYLGGYCEFKLGDLKQAEFWYNKASEDNHFAAHLALAAWFEEGTYNHPKSNLKAIEEYEVALAMINSSNDTGFADVANQISDKIKSLNFVRAH